MTTTIGFIVLFFGLILLAAMALAPKIPDCDKEERERFREEKEGEK